MLGWNPAEFAAHPRTEELPEQALAVNSVRLLPVRVVVDPYDHAPFGFAALEKSDTASNAVEMVAVRPVLSLPFWKLAPYPTAKSTVSLLLSVRVRLNGSGMPRAPTAPSKTRGAIYEDMYVSRRRDQSIEPLEGARNPISPIRGSSPPDHCILSLRSRVEV
jgi:hypothetical protein